MAMLDAEREPGHDLAMVPRTFETMALSLSGEGDPRSRSSERQGPVGVAPPRVACWMM